MFTDYHAHRQQNSPPVDSDSRCEGKYFFLKHYEITEDFSDQYSLGKPYLNIEYAHSIFENMCASAAAGITLLVRLA